MTGAPDLPGDAARHRPWPLCRRCCGIALDMGSARPRVRIAGKGTVVDVPTVAFPGTGAAYHAGPSLDDVPLAGVRRDASPRRDRRADGFPADAEHSSLSSPWRSCPGG
jgi:hypothetical protein